MNTSFPLLADKVVKILGHFAEPNIAQPFAARGLEAVDVFLKRPNIVLGVTAGEADERAALDGVARFDKRNCALPRQITLARAQQLVQSVVISAAHIVGNVGPVARHDAQKPRALKILDRQMYRRLVYPCALGKLALARQLLAGAQLAREYLRLYALKKALLRRGNAYFFKRHLPLPPVQNGD